MIASIVLRELRFLKRYVDRTSITSIVDTILTGEPEVIWVAKFDCRWHVSQFHSVIL